MPKIESTITNKQFKGQPMKDLSVPDETGYQPPQPPQQHRHFEQQVPQFDQEAMREFNAGLQPPRPGVPMKELSDEEMRIIELKKAKREGKERLSDGAKRRIDMLINMTRLTRDLEIEGQQYKLQSLKSKELREALVATAEFEGTIQILFETRKQLLARSLIIVAGVDIQQFLNSDDPQDRIDFIEEMDHALLLRLYNEYLSLAQEAQEKYALKTEAQVKEVVEDLKK